MDTTAPRFSLSSISAHADAGQRPGFCFHLGSREGAARFALLRPPAARHQTPTTASRRNAGPRNTRSTRIFTWDGVTVSRTTKAHQATAAQPRMNLVRREYLRKKRADVNTAAIKAHRRG